MPDLESAGEVATGAMLARAVEPAEGEIGDGRTDERNCLNCGTRLEGAHCHACGQKAHVHRTLAAFWHDLAHSVLHFDGKIWRTLPLLAWKPGELTRRYIEGERARFVSPMALFLFTVFLMFAIFSLLGPSLDTGGLRNSAADVQAALEEERRDLRDLQQDRAKELRAGDGAEARETEQEIRETEHGIAALTSFLAATRTGSSEQVRGKTGWKTFDDGVRKLNANPALALYKVQTNAYKFSWALIPISVPFVWLLFLHRRRYRQYGAYDHTVFVTYSITFMSLLLIVVVLLKQVPGTAFVRSLMIVIPPLHMYRQLRDAYDLSHWSAVWRAAMLVLFSFVTITLFLLLLLALGIVG